MRLTLVLAAAITALCACAPTPEAPVAKIMIDQQVRREVFIECLRSVPAGPNATKYNDWDEVVDACENVAYYQSRFCVESCAGTKYGEVSMKDAALSKEPKP